MVDQANLGRALRLVSETQAIEAAMQLFDSGGRILSMTVGTEPGNPQASVLTNYMDYPPQMTATIKSLFEQRLVAIDEELETLGVTGMAARAR